ncbi:Type I restriction-modification system, restriction subunit R [Streptococcus mitis]|uniref:Type I restriction-modification system, restriction subunit R n=1 Tax=Streptococcus mitis TaxID=28037 RepID=A0A150NX88_STRMT|nr:Type I restriction-modification system, restriction subunit R [Streptococcus mitis]
MWDDDFREIVDSELHSQMVLLIRWGNHAAHGGEIKEREAILALHHLYQFVNFIDYCYSNEFVERFLTRSYCQFQRVSRKEKHHKPWWNCKTVYLLCLTFMNKWLYSPWKFKKIIQKNVKLLLNGKRFLFISISYLRMRRENSLLTLIYA